MPRSHRKQGSDTESVMTMKALDSLAEHIRKNKNDLRRLSDAIWNHPELAYEEKFAVSQATEYLRRAGFSPVVPFCGLETAFRAESGSGGPTFAIFAEYDALPDVGHGCGHNLICTAAVAAFCAAVQIRL